MTRALLLCTAALAGCGIGGGRSGEGPGDAGARDAAPPRDLPAAPRDLGPRPDVPGPRSDAAADASSPLPDVRADAAAPGDAGPARLDVPPPPPPPRPRPPPEPVTCPFPSRSFGAGPKEVNTWRDDVPRVAFAVPGLPDPAAVIAARLHYVAHDADHPGGEGWIVVNGTPPIELPADPALDNADRAFDLDVTGRTVAGVNRIEFSAFDGPEGAFYRISDVRLVVTARGLDCARTPVEVVDHPAPAGLSAFAALAPHFPRAGLLQVLAGLARPFTAVLLDFGPVYEPTGVGMFGPGAAGARPANPAHLAALADFLQAYVDATPAAVSRHLQLYLLNGPGQRRQGYVRAYPHDPAGLDAALREDVLVRSELRAYLAHLSATVRPFLDRVEIRLVVGLEDNYTRAGARAVIDLGRGAGWPAPVGRNPCGCGHGDTARVGDFHEDHLHGAGAIAALPGDLRPPDSFSNDGWGFTYDSPPSREDAVAMARKATQTGLWLHLWYDPIQGYPVEDEADNRYDRRAELSPALPG